MAEPDNIVLELLRAVRSDIASMKTELRDEIRGVKPRLSSLELSNAGIRRDLADVSMTLASQQVGHDWMGERIERIERRLDLIDALETRNVPVKSNCSSQ